MTVRRLPMPPTWFWLSLGVCLLANNIAGAAAERSVALMARVSDFAEAVRAYNLQFIMYWTAAAYTTVPAFLYWYLRPVLGWFDQGCQQPAPLLVQRRTLSAPLVSALSGFVGWLVGIPLFIGMTIGAFGRWSPELASQHIFTPAINGYLAATISYVVVDRIYRSMVYPRVFPEGGLTAVPGAFVLGVRGRFFQLLLALSFVPMFVMLGLTRAAEVRLTRGLDPTTLLRELAMASQATFLVYILVGGVLAVLLTRSVAQSLEEAADALRRVQGGDLDVRVRVDSADEIGVLEDGVNQMVSALRDRERILVTFGRVVEPGVRDRLLGDRAGQGGQLLPATVLFCDLRGFTAYSEEQGAEEAVATLNEFFTMTTAWVRECGGLVDKFIGDAALVVFGLLDDDDDAVPEVSGEGEDHAASVADRAARAAAAGMRCALGFEDRLRDLNAARAEVGKQALAVTIAIHSGEVVAGVIGSSDRHEYTVVGDPVNVAARLQRAAKDYGGVVASAEACELARAGGVDAPVRSSETLSLRGRREPVLLHAIGGHASGGPMLSGESADA